MKFCQQDTETDIYLLLSKLKKNNELEEFHSFSNEVIQEYNERAFEEEIQLNLLIHVLEEKSKNHNFFKKLSVYEQELIGAMILGYFE